MRNVVEWYKQYVRRTVMSISTLFTNKVMVPIIEYFCIHEWITETRPYAPEGIVFCNKCSKFLYGYKNYELLLKEKCSENQSKENK